MAVEPPEMKSGVGVDTWELPNPALRERLRRWRH
jgi:hypothetical protein